MTEFSREIGTDRREQIVGELYQQIEAANDKLGLHCRNVGDYSRKIAAAASAPYPMREAIEKIGRIHDVGKTDNEIRFLLGIPFGEPITNEQYALFKTHARKGAEMVRTAGLPSTWAYVVATHHEDFDGTGYPFGLQGDEIPLASQVIRIADSFAAITERTGRDEFDAYSDIMDGMGTKYNPRFQKPFEWFFHVQYAHMV